VGFWAKLTGRKQEVVPERTPEPRWVESPGVAVEMTGTTTFGVDEARVLFASRGQGAGGMVTVAASLVREPENPVDPDAVAVHVEGARIGYLPSGFAEQAPVAVGEPAPCQIQLWAVTEDGKLRTRGWVWWGTSTPAWPHSSENPPPLTRDRRRAADAAATTRMVDEALAEGGSRADQFHAGLVGRYHYLETAEPIKQLKREGRLQEALVLCYGAIEGAERDRQGREPAPWYTEQAAIIHRKLGDRDAEIAVLERWMLACPPSRREGSKVAERLAKVKGRPSKLPRQSGGQA